MAHCNLQSMAVIFLKVFNAFIGGLPNCNPLLTSIHSFNRLTRDVDVVMTSSRSLTNLFIIYIIYYFSGIQSLGLLSIDPLFVTEMILDQGSDSPVAVKLKFMNESITGFGDMAIMKVE